MYCISIQVSMDILMQDRPPPLPTSSFLKSYLNTEMKYIITFPLLELLHMLTVLVLYSVSNN